MFEKQVRLSLIFFVLFVLQYSCFSLIPFKGAFPDLLSILIVFYAQYVRKSRLLVFAFCVGLVKDMFSAEFFGMIAVASCAAAYVLYYLVRKFPQGRVSCGMILVCCYTFLVHMQLLCFSFIADGYYGLGNGVMIFVAPTVIYTVCVSAVLLWILKLLMRDSLRQYNLF